MQSKESEVHAWCDAEFAKGNTPTAAGVCAAVEIGKSAAYRHVASWLEAHPDASELPEGEVKAGDDVVEAAPPP